MTPTAAMTLPDNACDSHCHIYGPFDRYPLPPDRSFTPPEAPETALRALHTHLGFSRAVIVQSQGHGTDHRPMLEALKTGAGRYRGVALLHPRTTEAEIATLATQHVCGARFNFVSHLRNPFTPAAMQATIARIHAHAWHAAIHVSGPGLLEHEAFIRTLPATIVIDHMARPNPGEPLDGPLLKTLRNLLDTGRVWVKLSGADRIPTTKPPYTEGTTIAHHLATHAPPRVVWGTDWPHVNHQGPTPDDPQLVDLLASIAPTQAARQTLLVDNPTTLFAF